MNRSAFLSGLKAKYGSVVSQSDIRAFTESNGEAWPYWLLQRVEKAGRGRYNLDSLDASTLDGPASLSRKPAGKSPKGSLVPVAAPVEAPEPSPLSFAVPAGATRDEVMAKVHGLMTNAAALSVVPSKSPEFVQFGDFDIVKRTLATRIFAPIFITGHSGNGKTFQVEQACAILGREYIRVNVTMETEEDDLIGGFRLVDGNTVFELGPVAVAMLRGAVLMLDEIDLGGSKIMCLQPVLEGKPVTIKKLGVSIAPAPGFMVIATANTKGRGSDDGKYIGTNLLNEAFLERFNFTIEQQYPGVAVEKRILTKHFEGLGGEMTATVSTLFETLAKWADMIRTTFNEGGVDDLISTRRLCHIVKTYAIFGDMDQALRLCLNRFDKQVQSQFLEFWSKLAPVESAPVDVPAAPVEPETPAAKPARPSPF